MSEKFTIGRQVDSPPTSLAQMLKHQYVSREFNSIMASTEIREWEVPGTAGVISARFVSMIMSTEKEDLEGLEGEQLKTIEERLRIKNRILRSPNTMAFVIQDTYLYAFGLLRQSLKRQSRREAMQIAMSPRPVSPAENLGLKDKLFASLGVSRKYGKKYVEKE